MSTAKKTSNLSVGAGTLLLSNPAGSEAGDAGSTMHLGYAAKFNATVSSFSGTVNVLVRRTENGVERTYQVRSNVLTKLSVDKASQTTIVTGTATISDITNPVNPIVVEQNATVRLTVTEGGTGVDKVGITIRSSLGALWSSSNWSGTATLQQVLAAGETELR